MPCRQALDTLDTGHLASKVPVTWPVSPVLQSSCGFELVVHPLTMTVNCLLTVTSFHLCAPWWWRLCLPALAAQWMLRSPLHPSSWAALSSFLQNPGPCKTLLFSSEGCSCSICSPEIDLKVIHSCFPLPTPSKDRHSGGHSFQLGDILGSISRDSKYKVPQVWILHLWGSHLLRPLSCACRRLPSFYVLMWSLLHSPRSLVSVCPNVLFFSKGTSHTGLGPTLISLL